MSGETRPWATKGATAEFAEFVSATRFEDLPDDVVDAVTWVILDTIGVSVAGAPTPASRMLGEVMQTYGGEPVATAIGRPFRTDPATAALLNGTAGHALDYDDYCFAMSGHPSVTLLPPTLALAERYGLTGRDVIRAYAVGFEAAIMLSHVVNPDHYGHGWHGTGTIGAIGAASAAANLLGLDVEQTKNAISLGASSSAGLRQNFGTDIKPYHAGNAARAGVLAAELAAKGFGGDHQILEGGFGYFNVFTSAPSQERPHPAKDFGAPWSTQAPGITTKLFPSCGSTHTAIAGALELRQAGLLPEHVERIEVDLTDISAGNLQYPKPTTGLEAKFSLQYCVAGALANGWLGIDDFTDESVNSGSLDELISRVDMRHDPKLTEAYVWGQHRPAVITVTRRDGSVINHRVDAPLGSPENFSREMLIDKFHDCVSRGSVVGEADELAAGFEHLESCDDLGPLMAGLAGK